MRAKGVYLIPGLILAAAWLSLHGCIESRIPSELRTHPSEWTDPASVDFHGTRVQARGQAECMECHRQASPGVMRVPSCDECHLGAGGHPAGWMSESSPDFHGAAVAARGPTPCARCHGADYRGGTAGVSCYTCHADGPSGHPEGWLNPRAASFHGRRVLEQGLGDCRRCHGSGLDGGTSRVSCSQCHEDEGGGD